MYMASLFDYELDFYDIGKDIEITPVDWIGL